MLRRLFDALKGKTEARPSAADQIELRAGIGNLGAEISLGTASTALPPLQPGANVNQSSPRDCYVYAHVDPQGNIFYIGRGSGRRAWSRDRERLWQRYVETHLHGKYAVRILADGLSPADAENLEARWMDQENEGLINLQNMARRIDLDALRRRDELMARNKELLEQAKALERTDREAAIARYEEAFALLKQFAVIRFETGLYGRIFAEHAEENGPIGQISLLDRLTLCLVRAGRPDEARRYASEYFSIFKSERSLAAAATITKRLAMK
jgi:hypothetical protein